MHLDVCSRINELGLRWLDYSKASTNTAGLNVITYTRDSVLHKLIHNSSFVVESELKNRRRVGVFLAYTAENPMIISIPMKDSSSREPVSLPLLFFVTTVAYIEKRIMNFSRKLWRIGLVCRLF